VIGVSCDLMVPRGCIRGRRLRASGERDLEVSSKV